MSVVMLHFDFYLEHMTILTLQTHRSAAVSMITRLPFKMIDSICINAFRYLCLGFVHLSATQVDTTAMSEVGDGRHISIRDLLLKTNSCGLYVLS